MVSALGAVVGAALLALHAAPAALAKGAAGLPGAWAVRVTPQAEGGLPPAPEFNSTLNFQLGGTLTELNSGIDLGVLAGIAPELAGARGEGSQGSWKRLAVDLYEGRFITLLGNAAGDAVGYIDTRIAIHLPSGEAQFTGEGVSSIYLGSVLEGELLLEGARTEIRGRRIGL